MANFGFNNNWIVMFGGRNGTLSNYGTSNEEKILFGDTWLLFAPTLAIPGSTLGWTPVTIVSAPKPRWKHAMASLGIGPEQDAPKVVMFGGCEDIDCTNLLADTWVLTGQQTGGKKNLLMKKPIWSMINMMSSPSKRRSHAMAFLGVLSGNKVLLFGGACASGLRRPHVQPCDDKNNGLTWEFDGTTWIQSPTDGISLPAAAELSPRYDMTMAALPAGSWSKPLAGGFTVVMLGGTDKDGHEIKGL